MEANKSIHFLSIQIHQLSRQRSYLEEASHEFTQYPVGNFFSLPIWELKICLKYGLVCLKLARLQGVVEDVMVACRQVIRD